MAIKEYPDLDILVANLANTEQEISFDTANRSRRQPFPRQILRAIRLSRHYVSAMCQRDGGRVVFVAFESNPKGSTEVGLLNVAQDLQHSAISSLAELICGSKVIINSVLLPAPRVVRGILDLNGFPPPASPHNTAQLSARRSMDGPPTRLKVTPEQVATLIAFLCSPRSSAIGSATIRIGFQSRGMGEPDNEATWQLPKD